MVTSPARRRWNRAVKLVRDSGDVGEMVVDVIGGQIDRITDDVGEILVDFLLICPKMSFF